MSQDDLDQFRVLGVRRGTKCWYQLLTLPTAERELLDRALQDPTISARAVGRWLEQRDVLVNHQSISRHSRRDCGCNK